MSKTTIESVKREIQAGTAVVEKLRKSMEAAEKEAGAYRTKAREAAAAGNVEKYREMNAAASASEDVANVAQIQIREMAPQISTEKAKEAWANRLEDYNKEKAEILKKLEKARGEYVAALEAAVELQNAALLDREYLGELIGFIPAEFTEAAKLERILPLDKWPAERRPEVNFFNYSVDAEFYAVAKNVDNLEAGKSGDAVKFNTVIRHNRPYKA